MKKKKRKPGRRKNAGRVAPDEAVIASAAYRQACSFAEKGEFAQARLVYEQVSKSVLHGKTLALARNDLAAILAAEGDWEGARKGFDSALALDPECTPAIRNLEMLKEPPVAAERQSVLSEPSHPTNVAPGGSNQVRVAILSFLFNWPSTGGGIVHTVELAQFLAKAGYEVHHFYARYPGWEVGRVQQAVPFPSEALDFDDAGWNRDAILYRFREAVDRFDPDHVIVTDSWNMKPILAEAVRGYPTILRFQAMECLCPLNNVRLLFEPDGRFRQCSLHQFANPKECARCVETRGRFSGSLHQAERALAGVGTPEYHERLLRSLREAEAVFVVNPLHEAMLSPYTEQVRVVTAGMDPARFPWPAPEEPGRHADGKLSLFFAGLIEEAMKGFHVLHEACTTLWKKRQDFELVATGDPPGQVDAFTRLVGWQSQEELPRQLRACDVLVMPTIAQEALGRTAVEAMAAGKPVIASRLGGLPFTVLDGATGLLCEPGNAADLARKIETLLDDPALRQRLGQAGRQRFEGHYAWPVIIERHYRPVLDRLCARKT